jgi:hypothetical protein
MSALSATVSAMATPAPPAPVLADLTGTKYAIVREVMLARGWHVREAGDECDEADDAEPRL